MNIGEPVRRIVVEPLELPVSVPDREPVEEPTFASEPEPVEPVHAILVGDLAEIWDRV